MIKYLTKLKYKKGFTLVEVIIVLIILAILATIMIPTFTKYIDRANEKTLVVEAKRAFQAAQTAISEVYAVQKSTFVKYVKGKTMTVKTPELNADGTIKVDKNGNTVYGKAQKTGRISNSSLYYAQMGKTSGAQNKIDEDMALQVLKYLESDKKSSAAYTFNHDSRIGKSTALSTADGYFKTNTKDDVALTIYYSEKGRVLMVHFAKRGINKIVEVGASGAYRVVESVLVTA